MIDLPSLLARIGWSEAELARRLGRSVTWVRRRKSGAVAMEREYETWLRELADMIERHEPPRTVTVTRPAPVRTALRASAKRVI